jgi:AraC-like DNA-binding protein
MPSVQLKEYAQASPRRLSQLEWNDCALIHIEQGVKRIFKDSHSWEVPTNQWVWLPAGSPVDIQNLGEQTLYRARAVVFRRDFLTQHLPANEPSQPNPQILTEVSANFKEAWTRLWEQGELPAEVIQSRALEVLAWLGAQGIQRAPLVSTFKNRMAEIYGTQPSNPWNIEDFASKLQISTDTLQRRLQNEGTSYRTFLRSLRMEYALDLLQTTHTTIEWIASEVGYQSRSKFALRFKERFGVNPHQIRHLE